MATITSFAVTPASAAIAIGSTQHQERHHPRGELGLERQHTRNREQRRLGNRSDFGQCTPLTLDRIRIFSYDIS
jgi:hypothetical protein